MNYQVLSLNGNISNKLVKTIDFITSSGLMLFLGTTTTRKQAAIYFITKDNKITKMIILFMYVNIFKESNLR